MDNSIKAERTTPVLYLVVPCYNEEEVIERSAQVVLHIWDIPHFVH